MGCFNNAVYHTIVLTETTAVQNNVALSYRKVHGLYFLAVVFATSIDIILDMIV